MALNSGKILMRRGQEANFDPNKMMPGEWAVSLDSKFVRMCFSPGVCIRMATYEAFEADMEQIRGILAECQTVEEAVQRIYEDIKDVAVDVERIEAAAASALKSEENALNSANSAVQSANTATQKATEAAESANTASAKAEQATQGASTATQKASEAADSAGNVRNMSDVSQSYAVGGTGTREGEDTDNAKYYNQQASDNADRAEEAAERASVAAGFGGTYTELRNKPRINDVELDGNKTIDELGGLTAESTVSFAEAEERTNIEVTDNVKVIFGKIRKWFADLKPHAFSNPTNNLLATVAGTALDAAQGKVLYDRDINMSVGRLAFQNKNAFGTLEEFAQETAKDISTPIIARLRDTTGAWGPGGNIQWYRCFVVYQNPYGSQYSLDGSGFMWDDAGNKWSIEITGNSNTTINFKHDKLITETDLVPKWGTVISDVGTVSLGYALKIGHQLYVSAIIQLTSEVSAWTTPVLKVNGFTFNTYSINYLQVVGYLYNVTNNTYNNMWAGQWEAPSMSLRSAQKCNANDHIRVTFTTLCD